MCFWPKGVGALVDMGGNDTDAVLVVFVVAAATPPKGVGAFADIGGKAADAVAVVEFVIVPD